MNTNRKLLETQRDLLMNMVEVDFSFEDNENIDYSEVQPLWKLMPYSEVQSLSKPQEIHIATLDDITRSIASIGRGAKPDNVPLKDYFLIRSEEIYLDVIKYFEDSEWGKPCCNMFNWLAQHDSDMLIKIVLHGKLERVLLTFAVEAVGKINDSGTVFSILRPLLSHSDALIREGVVYGLAKHIHKIYVKEALEEQLVNEDVKGVRISIMEALDLD